MNAVGIREEYSVMNGHHLELMASTALRHISRKEDVKAYVQQNHQLYAVLLKATQRFIGGETLAQCLETAQALQNCGFAVTIDFMGESTRNEEVSPV
jgi:proline dehydrogenase